ncbi:MAG TPA: ABC transporter permease [bacterium]|nr:ABC transporter permease [bacterium]
MRQMWPRLRRDRAAAAGLVVVGLVVVMAAVGPFVSSLNPSAQILAQRAAPPGTAEWFGRDALGRDMLARVVDGARFTLGGAAVATAIGLCIGTPFGMLAGYYGGWSDGLVMRFTDLLLAFPYFLLAILIVAIVGSGLWTAAAAVGITKMPQYVRVVRGAVLQVRRQEYVEAAHAIGASDLRAMRQHVLANVMAPIIVLATVGLGGDVLAIAGLSFLGLGAQPPVPEWGLMVSDGRNYLFDAPHIMVIPGVFLMTLVLALNLLGDGLRDALDPRLSR